MSRESLLVIALILLSGQALAVGYSATTVHGTVIGEGKFSLSLTAQDMETGATLPVDFRLEGDRFLGSVTKDDDGRGILFLLRVTTRAGERVEEITSVPWGATEVSIVLPQEDPEPEITIVRGGGGGPRYDDMTRDSEGSVEDFIRDYNLTVPPAGDGPSLLPQVESPAAAGRWSAQPAGFDGKMFFALAILTFSVLSLLLLTKRPR